MVNPQICRAEKTNFMSYVIYMLVTKINKGVIIVFI